MNDYKKTNSILTLRWIPYAILAFMLCVTALLWYVSETHYDKEREIKFNEDLLYTHNAIEERVYDYKYTLNAVSAFVHDSRDHINQKDWHSYINILQANSFYQGIDSIGYASIFTSDAIKETEEKLSDAYNRSISIQYDTKRKLYSAVVCLEPLNKQNQMLIGYDMFEEQQQAEAIHRAVDSNTITVSGPPKDSSTIKNELESAVVMYLPLYKDATPIDTTDQRRTAVEGFVYSTFKISELINRALPPKNDLALRIYDVTDPAAHTLLYRSSGELSFTEAKHFASKLLDIGERKWKIDYTHTADAHSYISHKESLFLLGSGLSFALVLFWVFIHVTKTHRNLHASATLLEKSRRINEALSASSRAVIDSKSEEELLARVCRYAVEFGGMNMAWIGIADESSQKLKLNSFYGDGTEYLKELDISIDPNDQTSRGPSGRAFHDKEAFWCQDFQHDPITKLWHERGARFGWMSSASIPLYKSGTVVGVLNLYLRELNAFDDETKKLLLEMGMIISHAMDVVEGEKQRTKAEEELSQSHTLLMSIINAIPIRVFWKDHDLNYLGCNKAFADDAGLGTPEEIIGKNDHELCWQDRAEHYQEDDREVINTGGSKLFFEEKQRTPDGNEIWLSTSKIPLYDKESKAVGVIGVYEDITARKDAENLLREDKNTVDKYLDIVEVMILVLDKDKNVVMINRKGCEIIGYEASEVIGKNWIQNFIPERFRYEVKDVGQKLISPDKGEAPAYFENPILRSDGTERIIAWHNKSLRDNDGNIIGLLTSGEDITDRRKVEEDRENLSQVVNQNPYPTIITDLEGVIEYSNPACKLISGYSDKELIGNKMNIFSSGIHDKAFYQELWDTVKTKKEIWTGTLIDRMKNGELRDCYSTIFPLFDTQGKVVKFVSIKQDMTEINQKEKLFMIQTRQAQMGEMISMIAHQWRQPLAIISAIVGMIRVEEALRGEENHMLCDQLKKIEEQSIHLSQTITDFKDFFRPDKDKEETSFSRILANAANLVDHSIKSHDVTFVQTVHKDPVIQTYANEVLQVVLTLIKNSIDAFEENKIKTAKISIEIDQIENYAMLSIQDNAGGISPELMEKIFLPYFTTKKQSNGTGLGLYMSKMIIEEHCHGKIEVFSDNAMAIFKILLPLEAEK